MKARLSILYFLQFGVWGCYLTCFGQFIGAGGLGGKIAWFYASIGLVSIITPPLFGRLADRTGRPDRLLALCHFGAAAFMASMWWYGSTHGTLDFSQFYPLYLAFLAFYMPTMALANTATFKILTQSGRDYAYAFPSIRIWGTVGFVGAMWFVNSAYWHDGTLGFTLNESLPVSSLRFQYNAMQLFCSAVLGVSASIYSLTLPSACHTSQIYTYGRQSSPLSVSVRKILKTEKLVVFLVFVILSGVCLQISNGFATPFITHFSGLEEYADSLASGNATMLFSLSQISEAFCILLVGVSIRRIGIRWVYAFGLLAWALRFLFFGLGDPGAGLWLLIGSMLVYGIAFNFITIAGHIYIQKIAPDNMKGFAQGLMMFMSNGIGATFGTLAAGVIVNNWCAWKPVETVSGNQVRLFMGQWEWPWIIFATYAFIVMLLWLLLFKKDKSDSNGTKLSI
ncbi:MAG: MFS transporter [Muribaculaceae bacterium]|nr:MFS transporter [Muribaculaceae bacterium]